MKHDDPPQQLHVWALLSAGFKLPRRTKFENVVELNASLTKRL